MAPSFFSFKELRRRSRASFRTERSTDTSSDGSHGTTPTTGSLTPPSIAHQSELNLSLHAKDQSSTPPPSRPALQNTANSVTNRYSVSGMAGLGAPLQGGRASALPISPYSPRITNVADNTWVYQKVLLINGTIGDPSQQSIDGVVTVTRHDDTFPPTSWPVHESRFKALVYLMPGANKLRFDFASPKLANSGTSNPIHASHIVIHMIPPINSPPLQLAILLGSDSPATFDAIPARIEKEGNGLDTAIRKFRMAAYLWQAFTAEQMWRNKLGRRVFRFEEEWSVGTANYRDLEQGNMRSEARVHVIRSDKTVAELRDLERAQQNPKATDKGALFDIASDAVREYFKTPPGQKQYVSVLLLDSHWDTESQTITGHAALGGSSGDLALAIFGSHSLQSYPASFEDVVHAFTDCTPTDTSFVGNDCNEAGSSWEAANIGIGAHLHETGHLFGCPHQESGVMLRDYVTFNRTFVQREAFSTRTKSKGALVLREDECTWHRLDCLRFRSHPCFRLPNEPPLNADDSAQAWPVDGGNVMITAASGVSFLEIFGEGDEICHNWIEYPPENGSVQRHVTLSEQDLRGRLPEDKRKGVLKVSVKTLGGGSLDIDDFHKLSSKESCLKLPGGVKLPGGGPAVSGVPGLAKMAYRGKKVGFGQMEGSEPQEVLFSSAAKQDRVLSSIVFYHGDAMDGLEFVYDDDSRQLFGKQGGKEGGDTFEMDLRRGEYVTGFYVRAGLWIDGIQVLTSLGRKSPIFGNAKGGSGHTMIPPRGYTIVGVTGSCGPWLDSFSAIITR
ncbi:hypothetical protein GQ53DRAFT_657074 [Thozetella sp. PMI_491]|nr:hypothetical protein GQ53DRAFT_657074 [Thozetella sp. PMI_491]